MAACAETGNGTRNGQVVGGGRTKDEEAVNFATFKGGIG